MARHSKRPRQSSYVLKCFKKDESNGVVPTGAERNQIQSNGVEVTGIMSQKVDSFGWTPPSSSHKSSYAPASASFTSADMTSSFGSTLTPPTSYFSSPFASSSTTSGYISSPTSPATSYYTSPPASSSTSGFMSSPASPATSNFTSAPESSSTFGFMSSPASGFISSPASPSYFTSPNESSSTFGYMPSPASPAASYFTTHPESSSKSGLKCSFPASSSSKYFTPPTSPMYLTSPPTSPPTSRAISIRSLLAMPPPAYITSRRISPIRSQLTQTPTPALTSALATQSTSLSLLLPSSSPASTTTSPLASFTKSPIGLSCRCGISLAPNKFIDHILDGHPLEFPCTYAHCGMDFLCQDSLNDHIREAHSNIVQNGPKEINAPIHEAMTRNPGWIVRAIDSEPVVDDAALGGFSSIEFLDDDSDGSATDSMDEASADHDSAYSSLDSIQANNDSTGSNVTRSKHACKKLNQYGQKAESNFTFNSTTKQYICGQCGRICQSKFLVKQHLYCVHSTQQYNCEDCGSIVKSEKAWKLHLTSRKHAAAIVKKPQNKETSQLESDSIQLPPESIHFPSSSRQLPSTSNPLIESTESPELEKVFKCDGMDCDRTFKSDRLLKNHFRKRHSANYLRTCLSNTDENGEIKIQFQIIPDDEQRSRRRSTSSEDDAEGHDESDDNDDDTQIIASDDETIANDDLGLDCEIQVEEKEKGPEVPGMAGDGALNQLTENKESDKKPSPDPGSVRTPKSRKRKLPDPEIEPRMLRNRQSADQAKETLNDLNSGCTNELSFSPTLSSAVELGFECHFRNCARTFNHEANLMRHLRMHSQEALYCPMDGCEQRLFDRPARLRRHLLWHLRARRANAVNNQNDPLVFHPRVLKIVPYNRPKQRRSRQCQKRQRPQQELQQQQELPQQELQQQQELPQQEVQQQQELPQQEVQQQQELPQQEVQQQQELPQQELPQQELPQQEVQQLLQEEEEEPLQQQNQQQPELPQQEVQQSLQEEEGEPLQQEQLLEQEPKKESGKRRMYRNNQKLQQEIQSIELESQHESQQEPQQKQEVEGQELHQEQQVELPQQELPQTKRQQKQHLRRKQNQLKKKLKLRMQFNQHLEQQKQLLHEEVPQELQQQQQLESQVQPQELPQEKQLQLPYEELSQELQQERQLEPQEQPKVVELPQESSLVEEELQEQQQELPNEPPQESLQELQQLKKNESTKLETNTLITRSDSITKSFTESTTTNSPLSHSPSSVKSNKKSKPVECPQAGCTNSFSNRASLKLHINRVHSTESFACEFDGCDKVFKYLPDLRTHERSRHRILGEISKPQLRTIESRTKLTPTLTPTPTPTVLPTSIPTSTASTSTPLTSLFAPPSSSFCITPTTPSTIPSSIPSSTPSPTTTPTLPSRSTATSSATSTLLPTPPSSPPTESTSTSTSSPTSPSTATSLPYTSPRTTTYTSWPPTPPYTFPGISSPRSPPSTSPTRSPSTLPDTSRDISSSSFGSPSYYSPSSTSGFVLPLTSQAASVFAPTCKQTLPPISSFRSSLISPFMSPLRSSSLPQAPPSVSQLAQSTSSSIEKSQFKCAIEQEEFTFHCSPSDCD